MTKKIIKCIVVRIELCRTKTDNNKIVIRKELCMTKTNNNMCSHSYRVLHDKNV